MLKTVVCLLLIILTLPFLVTCSGSRGSDKGKMAVVISTLNNPWFVVLGESAAAKARDLGYEAVIYDSQNNSAREAEHFDNVIAMGYDAILFNPTDADGSVLNVTRARDAGIPTFCMDREINSRDAAVTQLLSDNFTGCVKLGQYFVREMNQQGTYVEILGLVGDNNTWNRSRGFHSVVDEFPGLVMVAQQSADFDRNTAMEVMESMLQAHPDIDAVFAGNDAMALGAYQDIDAVFAGNDAMALGAYQAVLAAGKTDQIKVFGFDGAADALRSIANNRMSATVMQFPVMMAEMSAVLADEYIQGRRDFDSRTPVEVVLVTPENVNEFLD